uniref:Somatostatin/Cortistatin C-terminal domain-containing protein n=1 Tax=Oryzias melastigma TaxID=30732 RepID=A0A3B3CB09_ORYME
MARVFCVLACLFFVFCVVQNAEIMVESENLNSFKICLSQQSYETGVLLNLLYKLSKPESGFTLQQVRDSVKQEKNRRGVENATQRPCRVFYWKSWAKC